MELAGRPADRIDAPVAGSTERHVVAVVSEALICDFEPFGQIEGVDKRLERLERRGKLGPHRLITLDAVYDPPDAAEDTDAWFYARWLFDHQRPLLEGGPLAAGLVDTSEEALRAALLASLSTVDVLLSSIPGVVRWGDFALLSGWVEEIDLTPNLWMHRYDIQRVVSTMVSSRDGRATLTALGPRIESDIGLPTAPTDRPDARVADPLSGLGYLRVLARTGRWMADYLDETGGVVAGRARLLRLDDRWPCGGLWRSDPYGSGHPLRGIPTDEPLGLGWWKWRPLAEFLEIPLDEVEAAIARALSADGALEEPRGPDVAGQDGAGADEGETGEPREAEERPAPTEEDEEGETALSVASTIVEGLTTLRQVDIDQTALPLPESFAWLADGLAVTVRLSHSGDLDGDLVSQGGKAVLDGGVRRLEAIVWPPDFFAGIRLHLSAFADTRTLWAATIPLDPGFPYTYAFDPGVVGRSGGGGELTLAAVAVSRLRRHGRLASDLTRRASASEIATLCFGPDRPPQLAATIATALDERVAVGRLDLVGSEYVWSPSQRTRPRRSAPTGWEATPVRREQVREHWVPPFRRRLAPGWHASQRQLELYAEDLAAGLIPGPAVLPPGWTYVRGHPRGQHREVVSAALAMVVGAETGQSPEPGELEDLYDDELDDREV